MKIEIPDFKSVRVLVVGDVMLDRYWYGATTRISPEAPVPIVLVQDCEERAGGAGNVALNLRSLGCKVSLLGIVGDDLVADQLQNLLTQSGVDCRFSRVSGIPTVTKLRVIGRNQQLIRLDFENSLAAIDTENLLAVYQAELEKADIVIFSDYGKGTLTRIQKLIEIARNHHIPTVIDPKSKDFSLYRGATLVKPNLQEFEAVVGHCGSEDEIVVKGDALMNQYDLSALLITRGESGMTLLQKNEAPLHMPTNAHKVYDVTGAGDTVAAVLGAAMAAEISFADSAFLANVAAGIVVQKLGAAIVTIPELRRSLQRHFNAGFGVLSEDELLITVADAKAYGETIVMTNGCFDVLHAGHVHFLEQAKALGKRLIVAVNDDASVTRLKGAGRPLNSLRDRMMVLASLRAVDWVVPFSQDTPEQIIKKISPEILVKGADYAIEEIAGSEYVLANGGIVKTIPFEIMTSTTKLIQNAKKI